MLKTLNIRNLTVFPEANLGFAKNLNVIVGENGAGKTHLIKMAYSVLSVLSEQGRRKSDTPPTKVVLQQRIAEKLVNVFQPDQLGRLARRKQGRERCEIVAEFKDAQSKLAFSFATNSQSEVIVQELPSGWSKNSPAYLPTRELLTIYPNFVAIYDNHYLAFEETWRDTCILLGAPLQRGPKEVIVRRLLEPIEQAMEGAIELDVTGRFYLRARDGKMEMPLVAEGLRKLGMLARLIATGALLDRGYLFWDEPEANLNPKLVKSIAENVLALSATGIQVFIATHSLFLLRELEILLSSKERQSLDVRFFGLHPTDRGVSVDQGKSISDIGDITSLDEEIQQSDRFLSEVK